jgi:peptidoglycan DL-endopeptidase CwlO
MTFELAGPAAIQARVAAIQGRFALAPSTGSGTPPRTASATAASFDSALDSAVEQARSAASARAGETAPVGQAGPGSADPVGSRAVDAAKAYLGVPYVWGGTDPARGLDCSGLVQRAYADVGVQLPRVAADQARAGVAVPDLAHARPGDLVAFGSPVDHIGIYVGDGKMVVAPRTGESVKVQAVYRTPTAIRRIVSPTEAAEPLAAPAGTALGADVPASLRGLFEKASARYGVPAGLLSAVARAESGYNPGAVSHAGAVGLMQLMPSTARGLGVDPRNPAQAVDGAARLLSSHLARFGSTSLALAAYNAGPGAVQQYGGIPPYRETQQYVRKVLGYMGASA